MGFGFGVWGLGLRGLGVWGLGFRGVGGLFGVWGLGVFVLYKQTDNPVQDSDHPTYNMGAPACREMLNGTSLSMFGEDCESVLAFRLKVNHKSCEVMMDP